MRSPLVWVRVPKPKMNVRKKTYVKIEFGSVKKTLGLVVLIKGRDEV